MTELISADEARKKLLLSVEKYIPTINSLINEAIDKRRRDTVIELYDKVAAERFIDLLRAKGFQVTRVTWTKIQVEW